MPTSSASLSCVPNPLFSTKMHIAFYVHHHGAGHLMRCLAISRQLDHCQLTFLGSGLAARAGLIPATIQCIHLPMDTPTDQDEHYQPGPPMEALHYAPLNLAGGRQRAQQLTSFFSQHWPLLLVVDVSVEVTLLARLSGIPTIVVRQHGQRGDPAHQLAYQSAQAILAPYSAQLAQPADAWLAGKLVYTGGFSRYAPQMPAAAQPNRLGLLVGAGGTSLDRSFVAYLASRLPRWQLHVIGLLPGPATGDLPANVTIHGLVADPRGLLEPCWLVIGNAGHNTVMEMASLNKRFIAVPEARPFQEQQVKAQLLARLALATVVPVAALYQTDWPALVEQLSRRQPDWQDTISPTALEQAARLIRTTYASVYGPGSVSAGLG